MKKSFILFGVTILSIIYFIFKLIQMNVLPYIYIGAFIGLFIVFLFLIYFIYKKKHTFICMILCIMISIVSLLGGFYIHRTIQTLSKISDSNTKKKKVLSIYSLKNSKIQKEEDLKNCTIGILAINEEISKECLDSLNCDTQYVVYSSSENMINDFKEGLLDCICIDSMYLEIVEENSEMENFEEEIQEVYRYTYYVQQSNTVSSVDVIKEPFTVLISGIDTRTGTFDDSDSRSDVNLVVCVNPGTHQIFLLSIPRDYYVKTVCDASDGCANGEMDKLTHTGWHGISTTEKTIENLLGIEINYNVMVNFQTIVTLVDLLDGVDVYSSYNVELSGSFHSCSVVEGKNHLNGECALAYARERYAYVDGDRQRGKNQMELVKGIIEKCLSTDLLNHFTDILNIMEDLFQTNMETSQILSFVKEQINHPSNWSIDTYSLNGTGTTGYAYELGDYAYVMIPDESTIQNAKEDIEAIYKGEDIPYVN